jgi:isoquinoline 1-oxidoreductase beta subunit
MKAARNPRAPALSRRAFLLRSASAGGGLVIGFSLPGLLRSTRAQEQGGAGKSGGPPAPRLDPNAFLRIAPDDTVTILLKHSEMGQGVATSLAMAVAEELECDWKDVRSEHAPADLAYAHTVFGIQMTGGSTSTWESFDQLRTAGAMARTMLIAAAAARTHVERDQCRAQNGVVICGEKALRFGEIAAEAAALPPPAQVALKDPKKWNLIGKPTHRLDGAAKITGRAEFGMDVQRPGMLIGLVARSPFFGGKILHFSARRAKEIPGVVDVIQIPAGIGVVAKDLWAARLGRDALVIDWDPGASAGYSTAAQLEEYRKLALTPGTVAKQAGIIEPAFEKSVKKLEATYEVPYLAHATMEPLNCTAEVREGACELWVGTQFQTGDQAAAAKICGLEPKQVQVHTTFLGGGFGRRASPDADFVSDAVHLAKATGKPVKVIWTREDDMRGGYYRPMWVSRIRAGLDDRGTPIAWHHTIVGQSILAGTPFGAAMIKEGVDETSVEGSADSPYLAAIQNHLIDLHSTQAPVPVVWWRSVGHSHTAFVIESFLDELAQSISRDPFTFRRGLLPGGPPRRALDACADLFGWGRPLPLGHGAGLAVHQSFGSAVAQAAEISVERGRIRVHRVACAIECGPVVNPDGVEAQMQGAIVFGLSAALHGAITLKDGRVEQSNFHDYPLVRIPEMPRIDVRIVPSTMKMGGVGEPGVPPIAPAVANAVYKATGQRLRSLPLRLA